MPAQVIDTATGQPIAIAEGDVADAWKAGKIDLAGGSQFNVRMPDGKLFKVPAESLHTALGNGAQVLSDAQLEQRQAERDYGGVGGALIAGAGGAAEQASLGLAPALLPDSAKKGLAQAEAAHPWMHAAGEVAGTVGLAAATEGVGLGGGLAGLAEEGAGRALASTAAESVAGRVAQRAAVQATKGIVEGAQYGVSSNIAQHVLDPDQHPLTAASIIADVGANALWGGALGAGMGALSGGARELFGGSAVGVPGKATPLDTALGDTRTPSNSDVESVAGKALGVEPQEGLGALVKNSYVKLAAAASGKDPEAIAKFSGGLFDEGSEAYKNRAALLSADADRETAAKDIRSQLDTLLDADRTISQSNAQGGIALKKSNISALTADVDPVLAAQASRNMADNAIGRLQEMAQDADTYGGERPLASALKFTNQMSAKLDDAIGANDVGAQYAIVDDLKRGIGKYTKGATALNPRAATDELVALQGKARAAKFQSLYDELKTGLEDQTTWKDAGQAQKDINAAWTKQIDASSRFHKALTTDYARDPENPWLTKRIVDPEKVQGYINGLNDPSKDLTHQAVSDYVQSTRELAQSMAKQWELPPRQMQAVGDLQTSADSFANTLDSTSKKIALVNQFQSLHGQTTGHGMGMLASVAAFGGHAVGGLPGGVAGYALGKTLGHIGRIVTQPSEALMQLSRIEGMVRRGDSRITRSIRGFMRGVDVPATPLDNSQFTRRAAQVKELTLDPNALQARINNNAKAVSGVHAVLGRQVVSTTVAGLAFLKAKLPPSLPPDLLDPTAEMPPPSPAQQESFLRSYKAVTDPYSVVDDLRSGHLSPEGIEVLQQVYPPLYAKVQQATLDNLATMKPDLDYQKQIGLSLLLGLPSSSTSPDYVANRQAAYAPATPPNPTTKDGQPKKSKRSKPMNLTSQLSPSQRVESGSGESENG